MKIFSLHYLVTTFLVFTFFSACSDNTCEKTIIAGSIVTDRDPSVGNFQTTATTVMLSSPNWNELVKMKVNGPGNGQDWAITRPSTRTG